MSHAGKKETESQVEDKDIAGKKKKTAHWARQHTQRIKAFNSSNTTSQTCCLSAFLSMMTSFDEQMTS